MKDHFILLAMIVCSYGTWLSSGCNTPAKITKDPTLEVYGNRRTVTVIRATDTCFNKPYGNYLVTISLAGKEYIGYAFLDNSGGFKRYLIVYVNFSGNTEFFDLTEFEFNLIVQNACTP